MRQHLNIKLPAYQTGHAKHMLMMAVCCGLPIVLLAGIAVYGVSSQSLETMILLICPLGMGVMMWMMMKDKKTSRLAAKAEAESPTAPAQDSTSES